MRHYDSRRPVHIPLAGRIESSTETLLLLKTGPDQLAALEARLHQLHTYQTPEFLVLPVDPASQPYLDWLQSSPAALAPGHLPAASGILALVYFHALHGCSFRLLLALLFAAAGVAGHILMKRTELRRSSPGGRKCPRSGR